VAPAIGIALAAGFAHYGLAVDAETLNYREIMEAPDRHVGRRVVLSFYQVTAVRPDGFDARSWGRTAPVVGGIPGLRVGSVVSVEGVLRPDYRVDLEYGYLHHLRLLKKLIGLVVIAVVGALLVRDWRRDRGGARPWPT